MENIEGQIDNLNFKQHIYSYSRLENRPIIKFMSVTRFGNNSRRHDIAFLTTDMKFYVFSLQFKQKIHYVSVVHHNKIRNIFKKFILNENTEILIQDTVDQNSPLVMFFNIIKPYANFHLSFASLSKVLNRIYYKHTTFSKRFTNGTTKITTKNVNMFLYRAWDMLVESEDCPWISKFINDNFKLYSESESKHQKRARICVYYMVVRRYFMNRNKKCELNKKISK